MKNKTYSNPLDALKDVFGYDSFRDGQSDIIDKVIGGQDGLNIMATGGGKSITFQIPALCLEGTTIVISPLIALMRDQVQALSSKGVSAGFYNSSLDAQESIERLQKLAKGEYKLFYVAPERLASEEFINILKNIDTPLFAIDESHCISTWGKDFRLSYKNIPKVISELEEHKGKRITRYAVTASATTLIREDIISGLEMKDNFEQVGSFDRPNIDFSVMVSNNKNLDVIDICKQKKSESIIVYCATIKSAKSLTDELVKNGINAGIYHGRLESGLKNETQDKFLNDEIDVMVATNAFGMGVDKPNVRNVIHYQMPGNLENYYQEAGRAGRDGNESKAIILYNERDRKLQSFFIEMSFPDISVIEGVKYFLKAFDNGMPISFSHDEISMISPDNIKTHQVDSILRILEDQGVINLQNIEIGQDPIIEVINANKELDLNYLTERKKVVVDNLNIIDRFCKTKRCKREFLLDYFSETQEESHCGKCSSCHEIDFSNGKINGTIPEGAIRSVLSLVSALNGKVNKKDLIEVALGLNNRIFKFKGIDKLEKFGVLSTYTKSDVVKMIEHFIKSKIIHEDKILGNKVKITPDGLVMLSSQKNISINAPTGIKPNRSRIEKKESKVESTSSVMMDTRLFEKLSRLRANLSQIHEKPPFMIFSDSTLKKIVFANPQSINELNTTGLTPSKIKIFGNEIIQIITDNEKNLDVVTELDAPF